MGINRKTVRWYLRLRKPAISIAGSGGSGSKTSHFDCRRWVWTRSRCERLAEVIGAKLEVRLSARCFYQDLVEQNDFRDGACSKALKAATYRFKDLRRLLGGKHA